MKNQKVRLYPLNVIESEKGNIRHIINKDKDGFDSFSEAYITEINPLTIKGWTLHKNKISNLIVVKGHVKFIFLVSQNPEKSLRSIADTEFDHILLPEYHPVIFPLP